ncbi:PhnE/PtxC family ABC transporter permease, partial [Enterococcus faecium]|uniref:PhnE/PtxC family ABC transporter permease n=1 Tax=Enterococcus faecium TaxID=1352 RepID=UPI003CC835D6
MSLKETVHFKWYIHLLILLFLIVCFQGSAWITSADFSQVFQNSNQMTVFLSRFIHTDFSYLPKLVEPMVKTLQMSLLGTVIGLILAIPVSFLATTV